MAGAILAVVSGAAAAAPSAERGAYIFRAAGCYSCHTDVKNQGQPLAGGRALKTPFGVFYSPNITPDPDHGIGRWSDADFVRALRHGEARDGSDYFPVFPYTSYTGMSEADILDLKAYIFSQPPAARPNTPHEADFPFGWRFLVRFWKLLNFEPGPLAPLPDADPVLQRGRYLVRAMSHCGECHTPRDWLGASEPSMDMAGAIAPGGGAVPNITPDPDTGIGSWSADDIVFLLKTGFTPESDSVGAEMGEVVTHGTSHLGDDDLRAIARYILSLPPVRNKVGKPAGA